ncbi:sigma-54 dependent transcriptional regulator PrdR [Geosporobacter ferrireducens]|uniref:Sigma-54-dependent Fis family transcriptional regulator n=1 Tax=Geosporobacter ferrireducens TaxID=1424294 RepID=A0A1D8GG62_9FIRM|nr:sigma-54 dependent transcriptional regulator PrdR [Geosporobacter ferrireducens]AOT69910.1 sigma-54-dependent Fis family transcriptional regulator [Geosporobacter ferrireducens]
MFLNKLDDYKVTDIMVKDLITVHGDTTLRETIMRMINGNTEEVLVLDEKENIIGMACTTDMIKAMKDISFKDSFEDKIIKYAVKNVVCIDSRAKALEARNRMKQKGIGRLPVIENNKLIGMIRVKDILDKVYLKVDEMRQTFRYILDNLHEAVCVVDKNGVVILWGDRSEKLYGVKAEDIVGRKLEEFFPNGLLLKVLQEKKPIENVIHSPRKGSYVNISAIPLFINGELEGAVSTDRDITEVRNLSLELEVAKEKLDYLQMEVIKANEDKYSFGKTLGKSEVIRDKINRAMQVAATNSSVLILGESGTGKEVFARTIHQASGRKGPFVAINCSAIPENLFESEMFGYEGGAFTGALNKGKIGKIELANKGTLFLDEIGDMPLYMQAKLLRVLQERQIVRVGGDKVIDIDVRIISATHRDLKTMVKEDCFREDLFYRLNVVNLEIPSLRDRKEDIPMFVKHFMDAFCKENNIFVPRIAPEVFQILMSYDWPGNIRELKNTIEHLVIFSKDGEVKVESLPEHFWGKGEQHQESEAVYDLQENIKRTEISTIIKAMETAKGNKAQAAKLLNIPRSTLYYKIKFYDLIEYL